MSILINARIAHIESTNFHGVGVDIVVV